VCGSVWIVCGSVWIVCGSVWIVCVDERAARGRGRRPDQLRLVQRLVVSGRRFIRSSGRSGYGDRGRPLDGDRSVDATGGG
jgi:hypothetical protein